LNKEDAVAGKNESAPTTGAAESKSCGSCGDILGTTGTCKECQEYLLETQVNVVTPEGAREEAKKATDFANNPPWYAKFAPTRLFAQLKLLLMMVDDYFKGAYTDVPWRTIALIIGAITYVVSPIDLIPDVLVPIGWTDDLTVVAVVFASLEVDLKKYAGWKRLDPRDYGL